MNRKTVIGILSGVIALAVAGFGVADHLVNQELRRSFDKELAKLEEQVAVTYDRFHYNLITRKAQARGLTATTADGTHRVLIDQLTVHQIERDPARDLITALRLSGQGVRLRLKEGEDYVPALSGLGYNDPKLNFLFDHTFDPASETLTIREATLSGAGMGSIDLNSRFSGLRKVDPAGLKGGNLLQVAAAIGNLQFHGASIAYTDEGLAERILAQREAEAKISRDRIVQQVAKGMREQKFFRFTEEMIQEVSTFLQDPGELRVESAPSQPVGRELIGMTLLFRGNLLQLFGVSIRSGAAG